MDGRIQQSTLRFSVKAGMAALCALAIIAGVTLPGRSADAAFPGANGKIAFDYVPQGEQDSEIATINPDGTGFARLTTNDDSIDDTEPAWSPNGQRIVFARKTVGMAITEEVGVMNGDGTGQTMIATPSTGNILSPGPSPAFSGDGTRVVYIGRGPGGNQDVFTKAADGSGTATNITNTQDYEFEPTWSPDSQRIAFDREVSVQFTNVQVIYTRNADGSGEQRITEDDGTIDSQGPNFSPDGSRLAFAYCDDVIEGCSPHEIATTSSTATEGPIAQVTTVGGNFEHFDPAFSPDGTAITFAAMNFFQFPADSDVDRVGAGGGTVTPVAADPAVAERNPDWQPVARPAQPAGGTAGASSGGKLCRKVPTTIVGTKGKDFIVGTPSRDVVHGLKGRDQIFGLQGDDRLCGGRGWDKIFGDEGDDYLFGGDNHDFLSGGPGIDFLFGGTPSAPIRPIDDTCHRDAGGGKLRNCQKTD